MNIFPFIFHFHICLCTQLQMKPIRKLASEVLSCLNNRTNLYTATQNQTQLILALQYHLYTAPSPICQMQRVPLRRVAHLRFHARVALKGRCGRVLRHLVVGVVGPRSGLVGAAQAVACGVVAVGLLGQAQGLQCLVWLGLAQAVQRVVAIAGLP